MIDCQVRYHILPLNHCIVALPRHWIITNAISHHLVITIASFTPLRHRIIARSTQTSMVRWRDSEIKGTIRIPYVQFNYFTYVGVLFNKKIILHLQQYLTLSSCRYCIIIGTKSTHFKQKISFSQSA